MNKLSNKILARYYHLLSELHNLHKSIPNKIDWSLTRTKVDEAVVSVRLSPLDPSLFDVLYDLLVAKEGIDADYFDARFQYSEDALTQIAQTRNLADNPNIDGRCSECDQTLQNREWRFRKGTETTEGICYDCYLKWIGTEIENPLGINDDDYPDDDEEDK
jgi:hypothetical protein